MSLRFSKVLRKYFPPLIPAVLLWSQKTTNPIAECGACPLKNSPDCCGPSVDCHLKTGLCSPNGCTCVPDFTFKECCDNHDIDYCIGGTEEDRVKADEKLLNCISAKGYYSTGIVYYYGVRAFGHSAFCYRNKITDEVLPTPASPPDVALPSPPLPEAIPPDAVTPLPPSPPSTGTGNPSV
jgi:hypothetical protein